MKRIRTLMVVGDILGDRPLPTEGTDMTEKGFSRPPSSSAVASTADFVARARRGEEAAFVDAYRYRGMRAVQFSAIRNLLLLGAIDTTMQS